MPFQGAAVGRQEELRLSGPHDRAGCQNASLRQGVAFRAGNKRRGWSRFAKAPKRGPRDESNLSAVARGAIPSGPTKKADSKRQKAPRSSNRCRPSRGGARKRALAPAGRRRGTPTQSSAAKLERASRMRKQASGSDRRGSARCRGGSRLRLVRIRSPSLGRVGTRRFRALRKESALGLRYRGEAPRDSPPRPLKPVLLANAFCEAQRAETDRVKQAQRARGLSARTNVSVCRKCVLQKSTSSRHCRSAPRG